MPTLVIAHRGASHVFAENTLEAFAGARAMGADMVELDVRPAAEGALAVHHDSHLADGRAVREVTLAEAGVIDLATALDGCEGMQVNIELKHEPADGDADPLAWVDAVGRTVVDRGWAARVVISSFDPAALARMAERRPELARARLVTSVPDLGAMLAELVADGAVALHPWDGCVTGEVVEAAHAAGIAVNVWTVDNADRIRELAAWGVDGICTNQPDLARALLGR